MSFIELRCVLGNLTIAGAPLRRVSFQKRQLVQILFIAEVVGKDGVVIVSTLAWPCLWLLGLGKVEGLLAGRSLLRQIALPAVHGKRFRSIFIALDDEVHGAG